ncbi:family 78 glycoside hydrolase catalytic domain [Nocardia sp. alder85J]|uniref:family 78 glycoside hydrolase catalytic domain n=1 Tax=Nocardia sp. alder85J TaxID=2862949 RepID=UPI001CD32E9D|nr:family 78 glycoside hydrolase catalytic domain [Nocardia sp. alder85J]MCX4091093.1 family 78 glycoside hydrolase catalytic domain [Nocardia sp. alder85J]
MAELFGAAMITADTDRDCAPLLRREFDLDTGHGEVTGAVLFGTALGLCELVLNGEPVTDDVLTPGWSSYEWRVRYARWEVTGLVAEHNVLGIRVGNGWYAGHLGFFGGRALYGATRCALAELRITFADGHIQTIGTGADWQSGPSAVLADDLYHGQTIDARLIDDTWTRAGADLPGWTGVRVVEFDHERLTPYLGPPVTRQEDIVPQRIWTAPSGTILVDFGQNLVGWIRMRVRGRAGEQLRLRHAEVLEHGELAVRPLRTARATDTFVLSGGDDTFEPTFTFHGFRYLEVAGWTGTTDALGDAIRAVVIGSRLDRIGAFECSDPLLNRLHSNIVWSMRGNFVDLPTDCPQRDERLGWTGDIAVFAETAAYLYDVDLFLRDWLLDLAAEQRHAGGQVPVVVPDCLKFLDMASLRPSPGADSGAAPVVALWNDAVCWVPWAVWEAYGDLEVLRRQYDSTSPYARRIAAALSERGLLESGTQLGDWLDPTAPPDTPQHSKADPYVVATACVYRSARIAAQAAHLLGHPGDAAEFTGLADRIRLAFTMFHVSDGRITSDATSVYALAICLGLLDAADRVSAGDRLAELTAAAGHHITTGFAGTPFILRALTETGHRDTAYRLLRQQDCPSWLYPVTMGATTMWERWDSMLPDGTVNPGEMTSFNHYAFGAVGAWLHSVVGGLGALEPGYRTILVAPRPGGDITWARAELRTPHGRAEVRWELDGGTLSVTATIPEGTTAVVRLPGRDEVTVSAGQHRFTA